MIADRDILVRFGLGLQPIAMMGIDWQCDIVVLVKGHNDQFSNFAEDGPIEAACPAFIITVSSARQERVMKNCANDHAGFEDLFRKYASFVLFGVKEIRVSLAYGKTGLLHVA